VNEWQQKRKHRANYKGAYIPGLYGKGMHDFIMRECEVGFRVAAEEDSEACGFGPLIDWMFEMDVRAGRITV
jgi:hypothetical protein